MTAPINPGTVVWSGENPGIYLKSSDDPDAPWDVLALFFRILISPHGAGRGMILLGAPQAAAAYPEAPNLCITDNEPMMRYLIDGFVSRFAAFRDVPALRTIGLHAMTACDTRTDGRDFHRERVEAGALSLSMEWRELHEPFAADVPPASTATGEHRMYSVFRGASRGIVSLNGEPFAGRTVQRDFLGGRLSSAFLAFAESWVAQTS